MPRIDDQKQSMFLVPGMVTDRISVIQSSRVNSATMSTKQFLGSLLFNLSYYYSSCYVDT